VSSLGPTESSIGTRGQRGHLAFLAFLADRMLVYRRRMKAANLEVLTNLGSEKVISANGREALGKPRLSLPPE
jgi:hypothetical protein